MNVPGFTKPLFTHCMTKRKKSQPELVSSRMETATGCGASGCKLVMHVTLYASRCSCSSITVAARPTGATARRRRSSGESHRHTRTSARELRRSALEIHTLRREMRFIEVVQLRPRKPLHGGHKLCVVLNVLRRELELRPISCVVERQAPPTKRNRYPRAGDWIREQLRVLAQTGAKTRKVRTNRCGCARQLTLFA